jgi:hypothetical protein
MRAVDFSFLREPTMYSSERIVADLPVTVTALKDGVLVSSVAEDKISNLACLRL